MVRIQVWDYNMCWPFSMPIKTADSSVFRLATRLLKNRCAAASIPKTFSPKGTVFKIKCKNIFFRINTLQAIGKNNLFGLIHWHGKKPITLPSKHIFSQLLGNGTAPACAFLLQNDRFDSKPLISFSNQHPHAQSNAHLRWRPMH